MTYDRMLEQMLRRPAFIGALDQSGGPTYGVLRLYGVPDSSCGSNEEMSWLVHEMRVCVTTAPVFAGSRVIRAILVERTMDGQVQGQSTPAFLWQDRGVVPFVKVDQGLVPEQDEDLGGTPGPRRLSYRALGGTPIRASRREHGKRRQDTSR